MTTTDIPEFVEVAPGDLIRAEDINTIQRQSRNSVRTHRHTRVAGTPIDDSTAEDRALQITADELEDGAVTAAKLADASITTAKLADGAVTGAKLSSGAITTAIIPNGAVTNSKLATGAVTADKLAPGAVGAAAIQNRSVGTAELADGAVRRGKLALQQVNSGTVEVGQDGVSLLVTTVQSGKDAGPFFPTLALTRTRFASKQLVAEIRYQQPVGTGPVDVRMVINPTAAGAGTTTVIWSVWTFAV